MKIACFGECMVELAHRVDGQASLSYGGDTLNTAVYLSRLGLEVEYVTALGDDPYSEEMLEAWRTEGVGTDCVIQAQNRMPGLYAIRTDEHGEHSLFYWRDQAPARDLLGFPEFGGIVDQLCKMDVIYVSGITLSLYSDGDRTRLFDLLDRQRADGGKVMFDTNHRVSRWSSNEAAADVYRQMLKRVDFALPTLEDEKILFGDLDAEFCAARHHELGVSEVAIKLGEDGCFVSGSGRSTMVPLPERRQPKDTTGAGDSFNAAYLAARLKGREPAEAAAFAHTLAGEVIMHRGAIIPVAAMPEVAL